MKKVITVLLFIGITSLKAQFAFDYLKAADGYFAKAEYRSAVEYYEKFLGNGKARMKGNGFDPYGVKSLTTQQKVVLSSKQQAVYKLAESYRHLNNHVKSEPFYQQASSFDKTQFPLANYQYGKALLALAKYDSAQIAFSNFLNEYSTKDAYRADAQRQLNNLPFIQQQLKRKDTALFKVIESGLNTQELTCAPVWLDNSTLLFTSSRADSGAAKYHQYKNQVYQATVKNNVAGAVTKFNLPVTAMHQGVVALTPNGNTIFISRWTKTGDISNASLFISKKSGDSWTEPVKLDSTINIPGTSNKEPFVMPDSKHLIFSSDRKDGMGGFDLWVLNLKDDGSPTGIATNLGAAINTSSDERAPYYHAPTQSLIFSTNGRTGMGGFDLFQSKGNIGNWTAPVNLGYPVNSVKDDIYFASKGNEKNLLSDVLLSSDRNSECCLELFSLSKMRPLKKISGSVLDVNTTQPLKGATVKVVDANNKTVVTKITAADGTYSFTLEDFQNLKATGSAEGYFDASVSAETPDNAELETQTLPDIFMAKPKPVEKPVIVMDNIYFAYDKADLLEESDKYIDDKIVALLKANPTMILEVGGHTDAKGTEEHNLKLSEARANAVKDYIVSKGIAADRLSTKGYGASKPIAENTTADGKDNPEGRKKNRRTEFTIMHE